MRMKGGACYQLHIAYCRNCLDARSPNTEMAAKVHCVLFGCGGTPPTKFKFTCQCVPEVLKELSEFF